MQNVLGKLSAICVVMLLLAHPTLDLSYGAHASEVKKPLQWALLVGIGEYANLPSLQGPMNDVEILAYVLQTRYGFEKDHIQTLLNEAATRDRILQEFHGLIAKVNPSDTVYIHYSGHGSQVKDLNGDESDDHKDETIVPYDGRTPNIPDITDDELNALLNQIQAQRVIVSIDACHSGSVTRGVDIRTRSVPPDTRVNLYATTQRFTRGARTFSSPRSVVFSSSAPHERALDGRIAGRYHGYFSYAVFKSLFSASHGANPQMIFENVKSELIEIKNILHRRTFPAPQLEVSKMLTNEPLFPIHENRKIQDDDSDQSSVVDIRVLVKPIAGRMVELEPARYLGGLPSSVWEIIPADAPLSAQSNDKILATVTAMKGMNAVAEVAGGEGVNLEYAHARLVQPAEPPSRISILLREFDDTLSNQKQKIQELLRLFNEDSQASNYESYVADIRERDVKVWSADGLEEVKRISYLDLGRLSTQLKGFLEQSLSTVKLKQLQNPDSSILMRARLLHAVRSDREHRTLLSDPNFHIRRPHELATKYNSLQLEVWVNKPSFLTILDVDSEGAIRVLFPSPFQKRSYYPEGFIPSNTKVVLPDSFNSSNRAGFVWDIGEPKGRDTLYIFASSNKVMAEKIREFGLDTQYDIRRPSRGNSSAECTSYEKLRSLLYANVHLNDTAQTCSVFESESSRRGRSRGKETESVKSGVKHSKVQNDWNAVALNFWIIDPL